MVALRMSLYFSSKGSVRPCATHHFRLPSLLLALYQIALKQAHALCCWT